MPTNKISPAEAFRRHGAAAGGAIPLASPANFWEDVAAGRIRLSPTEDKMVWDLRAAHWRWDLITAAILERRSTMRARITRAAGRSLLARWRKQKAASHGG